jgi:hypothetical protein
MHRSIPAKRYAGHRREDTTRSCPAFARAAGFNSTRSLLETIRHAFVIFSLLSASMGCGARVASHSAAVDPGQGPRVELLDEGRDEVRLDVAGLDRESLAAIDPATLRGEHPLFEVFVASAPADAPALLGATSVADGRLRFVPRFPFRGGMRYRAVLHLARLPGGDPRSGDLVEEFDIPKPPPQPPTTLARIYPSAEELPENQLKFYLHFTAPMSRGEAYRRVHLIDQSGREVEGAFLELGEELWDPQMRRFTLLFDPGRVKRGLKPREEFGPVLEEGRRFTLVVDRAWPDANGTPLVREVRKVIRAQAPDEQPVDPGRWLVEPPKADGVAPLVVRFGEPLDHSLALRMIQVADARGAIVRGDAELSVEETCWRFTPARPWQHGEYQLVIDTALEDLAGNSVGRAFDADVFGEVQKRIESNTVSMSFTISPAADR